MATLGNLNLSNADLAKRKDNSGRVQQVIEILNEVKPIVDDMVMVECNSGMSHKTTVRTGIPTPTWRKLYSGVQSTKSTTQQIVDSCGNLEARPKIDIDVVDNSGDPAGTRLSEQVPHIEGMGQTVASTIFYGDTSVNPERFMGLSPRFSEYTRSTPDQTKIDYNVLTAGGSGSDNTSIWYITWGNNTCSGIYPNGASGGLSHKDMGQLEVEADDSSGSFDAYVDKYKWQLGLSVRDWRACGRIANIDVSALEAESSAADIIKYMIKLQERLRGTNMGKGFWYMHPRVATQLRIQMLGAGETSAKWNTNLTFDNVEGKEVMSFGGVPIHREDSLLLTEAAITQAS